MVVFVQRIKTEMTFLEAKQWLHVEVLAHTLKDYGMKA